MKRIENKPRVSQVSPWDIAPKSIPAIREIGKAGVSMSPRLEGMISHLEDEFAELRERTDLVPKLMKKLQVKYSYHTISIEGNTLSESETESVIEYGITIGGKSIAEHLEAKNIPSALNALMDIAKRPKPTIQPSDIKELHAIVTHGIDEAFPGRFRRGFVGIRNSTYVPPPPIDLDMLIDEMVDHVNRNPENLKPMELAFKLHLWFVSIHPFEDGNGRVARLLAGLIQYKHGFPPIIVRQERRRKYAKVLKEAQLNLNLRPYYDFMGEEFVATLTEYIAVGRQAIPGDTVISLVDAARAHGIDIDYLGQLARAGAIPAFKNGKRWVVRVKDIEAYVRKQERKKRIAELGL